MYVLVSPTTYQLGLKAIEGEIPTGTFVINPQSVVQVKEGNNIVVATQPITQTVESVRIQDQRGTIKELASLGNNVYSLADIPIGNYILDVVVDLGSNKRGIYETILVILAQGQQPLSPQQIIQTIKISDEITISFPPDDNQTGPNPGDNQTGPEPPPECDPGFVLVGDNCEPIECPADSQLDPSGRDCVPLPQPDPGPPIENPGLVPPIEDPGLPDDDVDQGQGDQDQGQGGDNGSNDNNDDSGDDSNDSGSDDQGSDNGGSGEFFE